MNDPAKPPLPTPSYLPFRTPRRQPHLERDVRVRGRLDRAFDAAERSVHRDRRWGILSDDARRRRHIGGRRDRRRPKVLPASAAIRRRGAAGRKQERARCARAGETRASRCPSQFGVRHGVLPDVMPALAPPRRDTTIRRKRAQPRSQNIRRLLPRAAVLPKRNAGFRLASIATRASAHHRAASIAIRRRRCGLPRSRSRATGPLAMQWRRRRKARLGGRGAADERRAGGAQDAFGVRQQRAQVRAKSGCENDGVERLGGDVAKTMVFGSSRAMSPRTLIRPARIWATVPMSSSGTRPSSSIIRRQPLAAESCLASRWSLWQAEGPARR